MWTVGLWALPAALAASALALVLAVLCDDESCIETLREQWALPLRRDALLIGMFAAPALFGWIFLVARAAARFHNVELAAALIAVAASCGVLLLAVVALAGFRALRRRRDAGASFRGLPALALVFELLVLACVTWACRSGLAQLEPRLLAAPVAFLVTFVVSDGSALVRSRSGRAAWVPAGAAALAWLLFLFGGTLFRPRSSAP